MTLLGHSEREPNPGPWVDSYTIHRTINERAERAERLSDDCRELPDPDGSNQLPIPEEFFRE